MRESKSHELVEESWLHDDDHDLMIKNCGDDKPTPAMSSDSSSIGEKSMASDGSSIITTSSDTADDASSPGGDLFDLSEIMSELPIKRGLSKFYQGKSESFTSFSEVKCIEDLQKKTIPRRRNSKSCGNDLSYCSYKMYTRPKAIISKKIARGTSFLSSFSNERRSSISTKHAPMNPLHNDLKR